MQGDDLFLDGLSRQHHRSAIEQLQQIDKSVDRYLVHSLFYADHMAKYLGVDRKKFTQIPLAISSADLLALQPLKRTNRPPTVGYLARIAPEKGLHELVDAFCQLRTRPELAAARLIIAGWLGNNHRAYADGLLARLTAECGADAYEFRGTISREEKLAFFSDVDVVSVPATFQEPKGLYLLEAMAAGTPVVQPRRGIFPELIASTGGGIVFDPETTGSLANELAGLLLDAPRVSQLGSIGSAAVRERHSAATAARALAAIYDSVARTDRLSINYSIDDNCRPACLTELFTCTQ